MALRPRKPSAPRHVLALLAGTLWCAVGVFLLAMAWSRLRDTPRFWAAPSGTAGLVAAGLAWRLAFGHIARRNLARIDALGDWTCVFAFQAWRSYLLVAVMIAMGMALRQAGLPDPWLAFVHAAMGGALLLAGLADYGRALVTWSAGDG